MMTPGVLLMKRSTFLITAVTLLAVLMPTPSAQAMRDPLGYVDGMSHYEYVRSNPVVYTDPLGLASLDLKLDAFIPKRLGIEPNSQAFVGLPGVGGARWFLEPPQRSIGRDAQGKGPQLRWMVATDNRDRASESGTFRLQSKMKTISARDVGKVGLKYTVKNLFTTRAGQSHRVQFEWEWLMINGRWTLLGHALPDTLMSDTARPHQSITIFDQPDECKTQITLSAGGSYPFSAFAPEINYSFTLDLQTDRKRKHIDVSINGSHNLFPAYGLVSNGDVKHEHQPKSSGPGLFNLSWGTQFSEEWTVK